MDYMTTEILEEAERESRFEDTDTDLLEIWGYPNGLTSKPNHIQLIWTDQSGNRVDRLLETVSECKPSAIDGIHPIWGLRLLIQKSSAEHTADAPAKIPWKNKETFDQVSKAIKLPLVYLRAVSCWSGVVRAIRAQNSEIPEARLDFVAQNTNYNLDSWSLALSFDPRISVTSGVFCGNVKANPDLIVKHLEKSKQLALHPMLLPVILFNTLLDSSVQHGKDLRMDIVDIERSLFDYSEKGGGEDGAMDDNSLNRNFEFLKDMGRRLNTSLKKQASRDGRHGFQKQFSAALSYAFKEVDNIVSLELRRAVCEAKQKLHEWKFVDDGIFDSLESRDVNWRKRIKTQEIKVYNLITQQTSQYQASIAKATKQDSADMKFFAFLTSVFLPANVVAAMLAITKFQFTENGWLLFAAFWGFTLPLVVICLVSYRFRGFFSKTRTAPPVLVSVSTETDDTSTLIDDMQSYVTTLPKSLTPLRSRRIQRLPEDHSPA